MNARLQIILLITAIAFALFYIVRKFIWKPWIKRSHPCDSDQCGCH